MHTVTVHRIRRQYRVTRQVTPFAMTPPASGIDFSSESDAELLGFMAMRAEEPDAARDAFAEFHERHTQWLYTTIARNTRLQRLVGGAHAVEDLVHSTLVRAYERAETYVAGETCDGDAAERRVRAWLGAIANNLIRDELRAESASPQLIPAEELAIELAAEAHAPASSESEKLVRQVLSTLSEREEDVILTWAYFYKPGEAHQRMPNADSAALAARWNTTPENIRQIRHRAFDKIKNALEQVQTAAITEATP